MRTRRWVWLLCVSALGGCGPGAEGTLYERLQDENPTVRAQAAVQAGTQRDRAAIPYLIDRLTDREPAVRMFAILALEKITGERRGYRPVGPDAQQVEAARRWRQWWQGEHGPVEEGEEVPDGPPAPAAAGGEGPEPPPSPPGAAP